MAEHDSSLLSATAQNRILVWRSEVASAFDPPTSPHSAASTPSAPSASSRSSATGTATAASSFLLPRSSRGRRFWRRITRHLSAHPGPGPDPAAAAALDPAAGPADVFRTAMYRAAPPLPEDPFLGGDHDHDLDHDAALAHPVAPVPVRAAALAKRQDRLRCAARLLRQQSAMGVPATVAP